MKRKKNILSFLLVCSLFLGMFIAMKGDAQAADKPKKVDGSYLLNEDYSVGKTFSKEKGIHLMDGECSITNAGIGRLYAYAATTANHKVDRIMVIIYIEKYMEDVDAWGFVDGWVEEATNDYYVATSKSLEVEPGYYYRVHAEHIVWEGNDPPEETFSVTDGIMIK